jgi:hypothetical protein
MQCASDSARPRGVTRCPMHPLRCVRAHTLPQRACERTGCAQGTDHCGEVA